MKSGNLSFLEPPEPLQACNRTDLPLPDTIDGIHSLSLTLEDAIAADSPDSYNCPHMLPATDSITSVERWLLLKVTIFIS